MLVSFTYFFAISANYRYRCELDSQFGQCSLATALSHLVFYCLVTDRWISRRTEIVLKVLWNILT
jgi:hypothetical protein